MTQEQRYALLHTVRSEVENDPSLFADIVNVCNDGIEKRISDERQRSADMETLAVVFQAQIGKRYKKSTDEYINRLIGTKLEKWKGAMSFNWDND